MELRRLLHAQVEVHLPGPVKEARAGVALRSQGFLGEGALVELRVVERVADVRGQHQPADVVRTVDAGAAGERVVAALRHGDGQAGGDARDAVYRPALSQALGNRAHAIEGQVVADRKSTRL